MVDVAHGDAGVVQHVVERRAAATQQVGGHFLEVRTGQSLIQGAPGCRQGSWPGTVLEMPVEGGGGELLRPLSGFLQTLQRDLVLGQVDAVICS